MPSTPPEGLVTHAAGKCAGQHCVVHNPSQHHMSEWPLHWRGDAGKFERTCPHGVGHPDPDDAAYWERLGRGERNIHGCDGCCRPPQAMPPASASAVAGVDTESAVFTNPTAEQVRLFLHRLLAMGGVPGRFFP